MMPGFSRRLLAVVWCAGVALSATIVQAQAPSISSTAPQAALPGSTIDLLIRGANLQDAKELWTSFPSQVTLPAEIMGNGTKPTEVTFRVNLPPTVPVGIHGIRLVSGKGVSLLKLFVVDDIPSVPQKKPNHSPAQAQVLTLPAAVDGIIDPLSRDYYKFKVEAGQTISCEVLGRRLGSPIDSVIRILDSKGREQAFSDDAPGIGSDSQLSHTFKEAGEYLVELRDIRYQGGANFVYRLRIGDFPCVTAPYPMGVKKGATAQVSFSGLAATLAQTQNVTLPANSAVDWLPIGAKLPNGKSSGFAVVSVSPTEEVVEVEPNNELAQAQRVNLGASLNGRFDQARDADRFIFKATKGQRYVFTGIARSQGSPADLYLRLLKADGSEIMAADDTGTAEGSIDYTFPADGDYVLVVEELNRRGGPSYAYRIAVAPGEEKFTLSASLDTLNIPQGGMVAVTVTANRGKVTAPIELSLQEAPPGIVASPCVIGPGRTVGVMTIGRTADSVGGKLLQSRIVGKAKEGMTEYTAIANLTGAQKTSFNGSQWPVQVGSETLAIGLTGPAQYVMKSDVSELVFGKDLTATVKIQAEKAMGFDQDITLAIEPAKDGLPAGVTAALKPIAKGTKEFAVVFTATNAAPLGEFSVVIAGQLKAGNNINASQPVPTLKLVLKAPFELQTALSADKLKRGDTAKLKVTAVRNPAFKGAIKLTPQNLPKGVTASPAEIAADKTDVELLLTVAADAAVGEVKNLTIAGEGMNGAAKLTNASAPLTLTVIE